MSRLRVLLRNRRANTPMWRWSKGQRKSRTLSQVPPLMPLPVLHNLQNEEKGAEVVGAKAGRDRLHEEYPQPPPPFPERFHPRLPKSSPPALQNRTDHPNRLRRPSRLLPFTFRIRVDPKEQSCWQLGYQGRERARGFDAGASHHYQPT